MTMPKTLVGRRAGTGWRMLGGPLYYCCSIVSSLLLVGEIRTSSYRLNWEAGFHIWLTSKATLKNRFFAQTRRCAWNFYPRHINSACGKIYIRALILYEKAIFQNSQNCWKFPVSWVLYYPKNFITWWKLDCLWSTHLEKLSPYLLGKLRKGCYLTNQTRGSDRFF